MAVLLALRRDVLETDPAVLAVGLVALAAGNPWHAQSAAAVVVSCFAEQQVGIQAVKIRGERRAAMGLHHQDRLAWRSELAAAKPGSPACPAVLVRIEVAGRGIH